MRTKPAIRRRPPEPDAFTVEEHLRLQRRIEDRAYQLWQANGHDLDHALNHWIKAEMEVLMEFLSMREGGFPAHPASRKIQPALPPQARRQSPTILSHRSIRVCQPSL